MMTRSLRLIVSTAFAALLVTLATGCPKEPPAAGCTPGGPGACAAGQLCDPGSLACRPVIACVAAACVQHQQCQPESDAADARCLEKCEAGFDWNASGGVCEPTKTNCRAADPLSLLPTCEAANRRCEESGGGASCTSCKAGHTDFAGSCEIPATCMEVDCGVLRRNCEALPNAHCTTCFDGFVDDAPQKECRLPKTCSQLQCASGEVCVQPSELGDSFCRTGGCGSSAVLGSDGICRGCPPCSNAAIGEAGPYLERLSGENKCICQTAPGYFWREGLFPGVAPCDADADGWVRESAKVAIESPSSAVSTNARCTLRSIDSVQLENEAGQQLVVPLSGVVALYETDRNDDKLLLDRAILDGKLPASYGPSGRALAPEELNSLVKFCADGQADFNENGLADVNEWHGNTALGSVKAAFRPFADFVFFGELHQGWYQPPTSGSGPGIYRVRERSRLAGAAPGSAIGLSYLLGAGSFWRMCSRYGDSDLASFITNGVDRNGLDFASRGLPLSAGWAGMTHHSQFKCVRVVNQRGANDPPHWLTAELLDSSAYRYRMNQCQLSGVPNLSPTGINPADPTVSCTPIGHSNLSNGQVGWAVVEYSRYTSPNGHRRGCVNECVEFPNRCPGFNPDPDLNTSLCDGDSSDFGKLHCGCGYSYAGDDCEVGCPGDPDLPAKAMNNLFLDPTLAFTPTRTGYWLCGKPSATAYVSASLPFLGAPDGGGGYSLHGEIPLSRATGNAACENTSCDGGYAVR